MFVEKTSILSRCQLYLIQSMQSQSKITASYFVDANKRVLNFIEDKRPKQSLQCLRERTKSED